MASEMQKIVSSGETVNEKGSNDFGSSENTREKNIQVRPVNRLKASDNPANQGGGKKILLIGGDEYQLGLIRGYCQTRGCVVSKANDFSDAARKMADLEIRAIITDLKTLRQDGIQVLGDFLSESDVQFFALGEQWEIDHAGNSLDLKKNSFLVKPLDICQLDCNLSDVIDDRVFFSERRELHRRSGLDRRDRSSTGQPATSKNINLTKEGTRSCVNSGVFCVDFFAKKAIMAGRSLDFTPKELELFALFLSHPGRVFTAEELIELAWPSRSYTTKSDLYQFIYHIRQKIEADSKHPHWLLTVKGFGYKFRED